MQDVLRNLANFLLIEFCKEQGIDPSGSHVMKNGRGFVYSLVSTGTERPFVSVAFSKHSSPIYQKHFEEIKAGKR